MRRRGSDFGKVTLLVPGAIGEPGRRRFRIIAENDDSLACLWIEKEQLLALGIAIDQVLAPLAVLWSQSEAAVPIAGTPRRSASAPDLELQVGKLGLSYDEREEYFTLLVYEADAGDTDPAIFSCQADRQQLRTLSRLITATAAAGRPRCPLCGQPIETEPHVCSGSNGHSVH